jgi:hypothetical protein
LKKNSQLVVLHRMIWPQSTQIIKHIVFLLIICVFQLNYVNAAETNYTDVKKTLLNIKLKYQALAKQENSALANDTDVNAAQQPPPAAETSIVLSNMNAKTTPTPSSEVYEGRFAVGEELIFSLAIGSIPLGDMLAIKSPTGFKVGLNEFFQLVDFAIDVNIDDASATGWYIARKNVFTLSLIEKDALQVRLNNRDFIIPENKFFIDDDIYVELADISDWFNVTIKVDEAVLEINLITSISFPIERRLQRRGLKVASGDIPESVLPLKATDYQLFSTPLLDVQLATRFTPSNNANAYSILSSQDAGYFASQLFLSGNDTDPLNNARLTLSRQSKQAELIGPLKMTEYSFGDVTPVNASMGQTRGLGRGFRMSNSKTGVIDNRRINLVGEVQVGWDVELYRNGILLDNRNNVQTGRYEFNDVDLNFGSNDFELVFYGTQGQIERRTESYVVDSNALDYGQGRLQFSIVENGRTLLGVGDPELDPTINGVAVDTTYSYGLTDWFSLGLGASLFAPEQGEKEQGLWLSSNLALGPYGLINSVIQLGDDVSGGVTQQYNFRTKIADVALGASYRQSDTLVKGSLPGESTVRADSNTLSLNMDGKLFADTSLPINYSNIWDRSEFPNGDMVERLTHSIGVNTQWGSLSHGLVWQRRDIAIDNGDSRLTSYDTGGTLAYRTRIGSAFARLYARYEVKPVSELSFIGSTVNYAFSNHLSSQIRYTYNVADKNDIYNLQLNWKTEMFTFSGSANYDSADDWSVNLGVRFGLGYDANTDTVIASGRSLGSAGAVVVRMFEDENLDNKYTEGEALLDNVSISAVQSFREENTSKDGVAILKSLSTSRATDIVVDEDTFSDPTMMVSSDGFAVAARRGLLQQYDIPVVKGGELDGVIYIRDKEGVEEPAPYVRLRLVNAQGDVISTTLSQYDGYYLFEKILPGSYEIRVDTSTGRQRGTTPERLKQVKISNRGDLILDVELVLRQLKSADGYIASLGEFSSLDLLKVYFSLLRERAGPTLLSEGFYIELKASSRYVLGVKYVEGQNEDAQQPVSNFCQELQKSDIDCKAESVEFEY